MCAASPFWDVGVFIHLRAATWDPLLKAFAYDLFQRTEQGLLLHLKRWQEEEK